MKAFVAILLLFAMTAQLFNGDFIILDYYTHQQEYEALCVNKDKPQMHCNGRCQMGKQLQRAHQHKTDNPDDVANYRVSVTFYCAIDAFHFDWVASYHSKMKVLFSLTEPLVQRNLSAIFRPPRVLA